MSQLSNQWEIQEQTLVSVLLISQELCKQQQQAMLESWWTYLKKKKIRPFWEQSLEMRSVVMDRDIKLWTCYFVFVGLCSFSLFLSPFASGSVKHACISVYWYLLHLAPPEGPPRVVERSICCGREAAGLKMFQCFITRLRSGCSCSCFVYFGHI